MSKQIICSMDETVLTCKSAPADRFVYSRYFVPYQLTFKDGSTPVLDVSTKAAIKLICMWEEQNWKLLSSKWASAGFTPIEEIFKKNGFAPTRANPPPKPGNSGDPDLDKEWRDIESFKNQHKRLLEQDAEFRGLLNAMGSNQPISELLRSKQAEITSTISLLGAMTDRLVRRMAGVRVRGEASLRTSRARLSGASSPLAFSSFPIVEVPSFEPPTGTERSLKTDLSDIYAPMQDVDAMLQMMKSDIGLLFLDRTRIRPTGFAIGEHVYALSLAPGEEIVVEQKAFTKRQETIEDETQLEREFDLEMSSTLTTELQEGMQRQQSISETVGMTVGGSVGMPVEGVNVSESVGASDNITAADALTTSQSIKQSQVTSSKVAAKYRTLHKTTFKITTEQGFESTSKRVIRNPNKFTPITLHYFKILQKLDLRQERFGVRLAWAPCISDPGYNVVARIAIGRQEIIDNALSNTPIPTEPQQPLSNIRQPSTSPGEIYIGPEHPAWALLGGLSATWGVGPMAIPQDFEWDGDKQAVRNSVTLEPGNDLNRNYHFEAVSDPYWDEGGLYVNVHVGVEDGGVLARGSFKLKATALIKPLPTEQEKRDQASLRDWQKEHDAWATQKAAAIAQSRADATVVADKWAADEIAKVNPVAEIVGRIVTRLFPAEVRIDCWQIDLWQKIFDWSASSYVLYPSWWTRQTLRDPTRAPTDFLNASFAKVYLPVRPGYEHLALRYIYGGVVDTPLSEEIEEQFEGFIHTLNKYRKDNFGANEVNIDTRPTGNPMTDDDGECPIVKEKFLCLGQWKESLPTDGTHVEVVLGLTSAADNASAKEATDAARLRDAVITRKEQETAIVQKSGNLITTEPSVSVGISAND